MAYRGDHDFWRFAVTLYDLEGVKSTLLQLQDENGLNIPLFLFALWCGQHRRLEAAEMVDCLALATDYGRHLIEPVRQARCWLGAREKETLYRQLLDTELACEKALMQRLEQRFQDKSPPRQDNGHYGEENAERYLLMAGIRKDGEARQRLTLIYRAYRHLKTEN